jgi:hypothetical protein
MTYAHNLVWNTMRPWQVMNYQTNGIAQNKHRVAEWYLVKYEGGSDFKVVQ